MIGYQLFRRNSRHILITIGLTVLLCAVAVFTVTGQKTKDKADQNLKSMARVNPSTLAMELSIPIFSYPGRAGNSLPLSLSYSSKVWTMERGAYDWVSTELFPKPPNYEIRSTSDINAKFSERRVGGWASSLAPPVILETDLFDQGGYDFFSIARLEPRPETEIECEFVGGGYVWNVNCGSGWAYQAAWNCCRENFCFENTTLDCVGGDPGPVGGGGPIGGGGPVLGPPQPPPHYARMIQQVRIQIAGGSHEFRLDDNIQICSSGSGEPLDACDPNAAGKYVSVDGSGMVFERGVAQEDGQHEDILYMPDGGRYFFQLSANSRFPTASKYIDVNGNQMTFNVTDRKWTDTLEVPVADPLPNPFDFQLPSAGIQEIAVPGLENHDSRTYKIYWSKLKPDNCENSNQNCTGSILDDRDAQGNPQYELAYIGTDPCNTPQPMPSPLTPALFTSPATETHTEPDNNRYVDQQRVCSGGLGTSRSHRFNPVVMSKVVLPNETEYQFSYNRYGELTKVTYPTGGYERFRYDQVATVGGPAVEPYNQTNRGVKERWVSFDGTTEAQHWEYEAGIETYISQNLSRYFVTTTAPDRTKSRRVLLNSDYGRFGLEDPRSGMAIDEAIYSPSCQDDSLTLSTCAADMMRRTLTDWITAPPRTGGNEHATRDPRPGKSISIIFEPNSTHALATMTENEYDTSTEDLDFAHLNLKRTKQYQYVVLDLTTARTGSFTTIAAYFTPDKLARSTETDYLYNTDYRNRNLHSLPVETRGYNASGSLVAKAQMGYDESTPVSYGATPSTWIDPGSAKRGLLTSSKVCAEISGSTCSSWVETRMQYDQFGNPVYQWDANQIAANHTGTPYATHTVFDDSQFNSAYQWAFLIRVTTPAPDPTGTTGSTTGFVASSTYDTNTGLVLTTTDLNGQTSSMEYSDPLLRPTKVIPPAGKAQTVSEYGDQPGNIFVKTKSQVDANNWVESIQYFDNALRPTRTSQQDSAGTIVSDTQYDLMGRAYKVSNPYRSGGTPIWTVSSFDSAGRVNQVTFPDGSAIHTSFGLKTNAAPLGAMTLETDQAGKERLALTDASGNLTDVWEIRGADSETSTVLFQGASQTGYRTSYLYDVFGKLHEVQQGSQHRYFMYDSLGRLIRAKNVEQETNTNLPAITDPVSQHSGWAQAYTYDPNGNLLVTTTARNATITNIYDAMSRVTKRDYSDAAMPDVEYKYDTETNGLGKPASVSNGLVTTRFTEYSIVGELLKSQQEFAGVTQPYTFEYTYNLAGQMVSEKYPSGRVVTNTFDSLGKLASVSSGALNQTPHIYANGFGYNEKGVMDRMRLGDGLWESYQVNSRFQTTEIDLGTSANSTNRLRLNYSYGGADNNGNVRSQTITVPTINGATGFVTTQDYTYDDLNRLASVKETQYGQTTPDWQQQFAYDRYGNRAMGTGSGQTFGRNSAETLGLIGPDPTVSTSTNRIINKTGEQYQFDASGNMTRDALGNRSVFDVENHQTEYFYAANTTQTADAKYFYDGDGRRIKKVIGTETTIFVYNAAGKMAAEYTLGASANSNPQTNYLTTDTLGSTRVVTNSSGQIIARHDYLPFGDEMLGLGGRTSAQGFGMPDTTRQRFTGYERDSESGLDFAQARYYGNGLGRFTGVDPLMESATPQIPQSWNRYGYCINNPLAITDPSGLIWGYQDTERDGMIWRQFQWFNGKKVDKGFTPFEGTSFTYADGKTLLLGDEGAWDWARQTQELDSGSLTPFARAFVAEMGRRNEHFGRNLVLVVGSAWLVGATGGSALFEAGPFVAYTTMAGDALIMEKNYREQAAEEKAALAEVNIAGSLEGDRRWAVKEAWHQESEFAKQTGRGATVNWTASELGQLTTNGKVAGYQGHHVNSVKGYPDMARNPDNVRFLTRADHFNEHGGNWSNRTTGSLCTRKLR